MHGTHVAPIPLAAELPGCSESCRFYHLSQGSAEFLKHTFKFSYQQPLGVNAVTGLAEACSSFALFVPNSPRLSLSKITFIVSHFGSRRFARGPGPAVGAGAGLGAQPESAAGPAEQEHRSRDGRRLATDFCADRERERGLASEPGLGLGVRCACSRRMETGGVSYSPLSKTPRRFVLLGFVCLQVQ